MLFKSLPSRLKIKIRLAEMLERQAEDAPTIDGRYDLLDRAAALRDEVEAYLSLEPIEGPVGAPGEPFVHPDDVVDPTGSREVRGGAL